MSGTLQTALTIGVIAAATWLCRAAPFIMFGGRRRIPEALGRVSTMLPASIMIVLVVYCLKDMDFTVHPFGLAELIALAAAIGLYLWRNNMLLSIFLGTAIYMAAIRVLA